MFNLKLLFYGQGVKKNSLGGTHARVYSFNSFRGREVVKAVQSNRSDNLSDLLSAQNEIKYLTLLSESYFIIDLIKSVSAESFTAMFMQMSIPLDYFQAKFLVEGKGTAIDFTLYVTAAALLGLRDVHSHGLIHGDIKPENILVSSLGVPQLCDFGLCHSTRKQIQSRFGTGVFMAPEICDPLGIYNETVDSYSLGISVFHLLSNEYPFIVEKAEMLKARDDEDYEAIWAAVPEYSEFKLTEEFWTTLRKMICPSFKRKSPKKLLADDFWVPWANLWEDLANGYFVNGQDLKQFQDIREKVLILVKQNEKEGNGKKRGKTGEGKIGQRLKALLNKVRK